jgi:hypothetical protein
VVTRTSSVCGRNVGAVPFRITGAAPSSETEKAPWLEEVAPYRLIAFPVKWISAAAFSPSVTLRAMVKIRMSTSAVGDGLHRLVLVGLYEVAASHRPEVIVHERGRRVVEHRVLRDRTTPHSARRSQHEATARTSRHYGRS